jgi:hypothetical protein
MIDFPVIDPTMIDEDDRLGYRNSTLEHFVDPRAERFATFIARTYEMTHIEAMTKIAETYPRIYQMIRMLWGTPLLHERLSKMLFLDTHGREGFDKPVVHALVMIHDAHMAETGFSPITHIEDMERDIW